MRLCLNGGHESMAVGQPAAGAAGLVELLFVGLDLAVDVIESLLRGTG
jgi:hypothetical protein